MAKSGKKHFTLLFFVIFLFSFTAHSALLSDYNSARPEVHFSSSSLEICSLSIFFFYDYFQPPLGRQHCTTAHSSTLGGPRV